VDPVPDPLLVFLFFFSENLVVPGIEPGPPDLYIYIYIYIYIYTDVHFYISLNCVKLKHHLNSDLLFKLTLI
jgi:hypothetical protein